MMAPDISDMAPLLAEERGPLRLEIEDFNTEYAAVLDAQEMKRWPKFFTRDAFYRITARENFYEGLPVGLVWLEGEAMFLDRVAAIENTMVFAPRYLRHYITNVNVVGANAAGLISAEANYLVVETLMEDETKIFQAGCYKDLFVRGEDGDLKLKSRDCIYDSLLIPNDMAFPV